MAGPADDGSPARVSAATPATQGRDKSAALSEQQSAALRGMNDSLRKVVIDVRKGSDEIATASKEIATGNVEFELILESVSLEQS
ncbi:hypothetical protein [Caballeronia grimmiae]|uniref:hypothetical protein n=1 Tax=Caballeronia grimmiae TaxID=1071679 RepID=UPI0038B7A8D8